MEVIILGGVVLVLSILILSLFRKEDPNAWKPACVKCKRKDRMHFSSAKVLSSSVRSERTLTREIPRDAQGRQTGKTETIVTRNIRTTEKEEYWTCDCGGYSWRWPVYEEAC